MLRFAISPTGDMDISALRLALINFIISKQKDEELLVRIDDTNTAKNIENKDKEILELLNLFGIEHSRVIIESENIKYHTGMGMKLLLDKKAFNCFCSKEALEEDKQKAKKEGKPYSYSGFCETISDETKFQCNAPFVVRAKKPAHDIKFNDLIEGECSYNPDEVDSVVILDVDKRPTADFASAVDDMLYNITFVITDKKHLVSTARQIHIRESLGYTQNIEYAHIQGLSGKELSVKSLIDDGFLPAAIANYLVLLGTNAPSEIFSIEEAVEWFDLTKISKKSADFDMDKLKQINKEYLVNMDNMRLSKLLGFADEDIGVLGKLFLDECSTLNDIKVKVDKVFAKKESCKGFEKEFEVLKKTIEELPFIEEFDKFQKELEIKTALLGDRLLKPLSYILTGEIDSVKLKDIYPCVRNYLGQIV